MWVYMTDMQVVAWLNGEFDVDAIFNEDGTAQYWDESMTIDV